MSTSPFISLTLNRSIVVIDGPSRVNETLFLEEFVGHSGRFRRLNISADARNDPASLLASVERLFADGYVPVSEGHLIDAATLASVNLLVLRVFNDTSPEAADGFRDSYGLFLSSSDGSPSLLAKRLVKWISATAMLLEAQPEFVRSGIGAAARNKIGYDEISPEFTDELRLTTKYFHQLTDKFWRGVLTKRVLTERRYLEVGPGRGWVKSLGWPSGAQYQGLELSNEMRDMNPDKDTIAVGSAGSLPYVSKSFDGVFGSLLDPFLLPNFLFEAQRVVGDEGWFAGTAPAGDWARRLRGRNIAATAFMLRSGRTTTVSSFCYTAIELDYLLRCAGFKNIDIKGYKVTDSLEPIPPAVSAVVDEIGADIPIVLEWTATKLTEFV